MGEVLPNSIQIMAKAAGNVGLTLNGTVKEMLALQQTGGLISSKVLPEFGRLMSKAARNNEGLEKALLSNRVAMNRFMFAIQEAADTFFKSGFSEGLTKFFNTSAESIRKLEPLWKGLGRILGSIFTALAAGIERVTPMFVLFGEAIDSVTDALGNSYAAVALLFSPLALKGIKTFGTLFGRVLLPVIAVANAIEKTAFWLEEIMNVFTGNKVGVLFDPRKDQSRISQVMENLTPDIKAQIAGVAKLTGSGVSNTMAARPNLSSGFNSQQQQQPVQLNATVNLDGAKVGQMILENPQNMSSVYGMIEHTMN